jgi:hypothetical protein
MIETTTAAVRLEENSWRKLESKSEWQVASASMYLENRHKALIQRFSVATTTTTTTITKIKEENRVLCTTSYFRTYTRELYIHFCSENF